MTRPQLAAAHTVAPATLERLLLEHELHQVLIAYALLCDGRDWRRIGEVFSDDASATYGGHARPDRAAILAMLRNNLGGCGPTQHLLGNLQVWVQDEATGARATNETRPTTAWATTRTAGRARPAAGASCTAPWWLPWSSAAARCLGPRPERARSCASRAIALMSHTGEIEGIAAEFTIKNVATYARTHWTYCIFF